MAADRQTARKRKSGEARQTRRRMEAITGYVADDRAAEFDRLISERVRLGIMSALTVNRSLTFSELKDLLKTTDGNLSTHARKLEEAGYLSCRKSFERRVPRTDYQVTAKGRRAFERYLDHMEALIRATRSG